MFLYLLLFTVRCTVNIQVPAGVPIRRDVTSQLTPRTRVALEAPVGARFEVFTRVMLEARGCCRRVSASWRFEGMSCFRNVEKQ